MCISERKIYHLTELLCVLPEAVDMDRYVFLYRCALKIADIVIIHHNREMRLHDLRSSKNIWQKLMYIPDFNHWAQFFIIEAEFVHRLEDGFIRWVSEEKYTALRNEVHQFIHDARNFLTIDLDCALCLSLEMENCNFELVS